MMASLTSCTALGSRSRAMHRDRKSTRLNSSHLGISYAVFCLKKKSDHAVLPVLLVLLEDRVVGHLDVPLLHVQLTRDRRQIERMDVREDREAALVYVVKPDAI